MRRSIACSLATLLIIGCSVGLRSGNLPPQIRSAAITPFENQTSDPRLEQEVNQAVQEAVQRRLGLRASSKALADAIVTGSITRYDPDMPAVAIRSGGTTSSGQTAVQVTTRQLQIVVVIEIINRVTQKPLVASQTITVTGEYTPGQEAEGRKKALEKLVTEIVNKARSQW